MYGMKGNIFEIFLNTVSLSILLAKASFAFLLISMFSYWFQAAFKYTKNRVLSKLPLVAMYSANFTLAFMLSLRWVESGHFPLSNLYESLLFLSWSLTSIHLFLERVVNKGEEVVPSLTLGAITSPLCLFTNAFATFSLPQEMQKITVLVPALQSNWLIMHVSVMIISYAALLSGSLLAMAFLVSRFVEDTKIKDNQPFNIVSLRNTTYSVPINPYFSHVRNTFGSLLHTLLPVVRSKTGSVPVSQTISTSIPKIATPLAAPQAISASHTTFLLRVPKVGKVMQYGGAKQKDGKKMVKKHSIKDSKDITTSALFPSNFQKKYVQQDSENGVSTKKMYPILPVPASQAISASHTTEGGKMMQDGNPMHTQLRKPCEATEVVCSNTCTTFGGNSGTGGMGSNALQFEGACGGSVNEPIIKVNKMMKHPFKRNLSQTLDNLSYRSIGLGFALLTIGILSGAVWANEAWGSYWSWDPKETWAFVTWLVFAFYLHTRLSKGWVGKESAFVAIFGFAIIWFCYLGVNFFGKGLHSYGWFQTIR